MVDSVPDHGLTARQREVVALIAMGRRSTEIAAELGISKRTVDAHRANIRERLGLRSVAELTTYAIVEGLVPIAGQ